VTGETPLEPDFLALKLLLQRVRLKSRRTRDPAVVAALAAEVQAFFVKYESMLGTDLAKVLGRSGRAR
jgi:hypothetical protein